MIIESVTSPPPTPTESVPSTSGLGKRRATCTGSHIVTHIKTRAQKLLEEDPDVVVRVHREAVWDDVTQRWDSEEMWDEMDVLSGEEDCHESDGDESVDLKTETKDMIVDLTKEEDEVFTDLTKEEEEKKVKEEKDVDANQVRELRKSWERVLGKNVTQL